jgi:DNA helicase II / ATP-dependent DNA helicase PcrA
LIIDEFLTYSHCYDFALDYLNTFPLMKEVFQKRFKYVFVDEVQDTDDRQFEIIDKLFLNSDVIIQRIGDKNQAIFSNMNSSSIGWKVNSDFLEIKNTKRLSKVISEKVTNFAISPQDLKGNEEITIFPTIILYDIENIGELVFKEFGNIIIENGLHNIENCKFKAVGAVGKIHEKGEITIPSYFPNFTKNDDDSVNYDSILEKIKLFDKNKFLAKDFRKILLDVVIEYLKLKDVKNEDKYFTKKTLFQFLENKEKNLYIDFKIKLFNSVKKLYKQECIDDEIKIKLEIILNLFGKRIDEISLKTIIKNYKINFSDKTTKNKFKYENADIEFEIDISTIHKIKGETHTATLVLETYKNKYDLEILLNLLKNKKRASFDDKKKLLYVAMSRPTHLLCFAMNKEHVNELDREELQNSGFIIKDI